MNPSTSTLRAFHLGAAAPGFVEVKMLPKLSAATQSEFAGQLTAIG
jgi:hypothetical protein